MNTFLIDKILGVGISVAAIILLLVVAKCLFRKSEPKVVETEGSTTEENVSTASK